MRIDVALLPALYEHPEQSVCIVVDELRATSTIATMFARGLEEIAVTASVEEARALKAEMPEWLLCGEVGGLPPEGFDHGNSPVEFSTMNLHGQRAIMATSNGTRALVRAAEAPFGLAGSLLNRTTVARAAVEAASRLGIGITLVCAGTELGRAFSLEDTVACGAIVEAIVAGYPGSLDDLTLTDSAMAAYRVWRSYVSPRLALGEAQHGRLLAHLGLAADLDFCAQDDLYTVAPLLERNADGLLRLRTYPPSPLP